MSSRRFMGSGVVAAVVMMTSAVMAQGAPPGPPAAEPAPPQAGAAGGGPATTELPPPGQPEPTAVAEPSIYVAQPPLPPLMPRTRHVHDGFYLRLSTGVGGLWTSTTANKGSGSSSVSGSGAALDLAVGGTVASGLVVGGAVLLQEAFSPARRGISAFNDGTASSLPFVMIGPMIDAFPNPRMGFHFGGLVGLASTGLRDSQDNWSTGVGLSAWAGYLWWASSEWSLGGTVRFSAAWSGREVEDSAGRRDVTDTARALNLMFSAAYH